MEEFALPLEVMNHVAILKSMAVLFYVIILLDTVPLAVLLIMGGYVYQIQAVPPINAMELDLQTVLFVMPMVPPELVHYMLVNLMKISMMKHLAVAENIVLLKLPNAMPHAVTRSI